jgi:DnaA-homolog protein
MSEQLTFNVNLPEEASFVTFYPATHQAIVDYLKLTVAGAGEQFVYLWGSSAIGKTHLLQACCHYATELHKTSIYLSLKELSQFTPQVFTNLEKLNLVCLDDIDILVQEPNWQEPLFHLFNRIHASGSRLILAAKIPPQELALTLADLQSRLTWSVVLHMQALDDHAKCAAMQLQAKVRGLFLPMEVAEYILKRCSRNLPNLHAILTTLDKASLQQQRKLTVPFVKDVLGI